MTECVIPLSDVLVWMKRVGRDAVLRTLPGCELDDGATETLHMIKGVEFSADAEPIAFALQNGARAVTGRLRAAGAAIVERRPGAPLAAAIEAERTVQERTMRAQAKALGKIGLDAARFASTDARTAVLSLAAALDHGAIPEAPARQAAYDALKCTEQQTQRMGAQMFKRLATQCAANGQPVPDDIHWRVACLLRYAGALRDAIAASNVLNGPEIRDRGARKILATTRAASLLDLWEATHEAMHVRDADAAFRLAWGIDRHDEELQALRRALNRAIEQAGLTDLGPRR